ncbi:MAG: hypothetical protein ACXAEX_18845 [Promethearchaeota archaeon]|jgi:hypothetical protein
MNFNNNLECFKNKGDLVEELNYYRSNILKEVESGDFNSALDKIGSAMVLLEEYQDYFNIEKEFHNFLELDEKIQDELLNKRRIYIRRFNNLMKEKINEANLENFSKLLAMLKNDVDKNSDIYNLEDISIKITKYFKYIKRIYEILSCYKVLNYNDACGRIFDFVKDIKSEDFPNLKFLILSVYQNLLNFKISEFSKEYDKISIATLSKKMDINSEKLVDFITLIMKQPKSSIRDYSSETQEVYLKKP